MASFERYMKQGCCEKKGKGSRNEMARLCLYDHSGFSSVVWVGSFSWRYAHWWRSFDRCCFRVRSNCLTFFFLLSLHGMASVFMMAMGIINISVPIRGELCRKPTYIPTPIIPKEADRDSIAILPCPNQLAALWWCVLWWTSSSWILIWTDAAIDAVSQSVIVTLTRAPNYIMALFSSPRNPKSF